jgi:UPF0271 protein
MKPHGALYHMVNRERDLAVAAVEAVIAVDKELIVYTLPHGELLRAARERDLRIAREFFADRSYQEDGTLTPRNHPQALLKDPSEAAERVVRMLNEKQVLTASGQFIPMEAETVCIHGDERQAVLFARSIRTELERSGVTVKAMERT